MNAMLFYEEIPNFSDLALTVSTKAKNEAKRL